MDNDYEKNDGLMMDPLETSDSFYDKKIPTRKTLKKIKIFPNEKSFKFIPSNEMIEEVLHDCDDELEALLIIFLLETGARLNEALRLTDKDISPEKIVLYRRISKYHNLTGRTLSFPHCLKGVAFTGRLFERWTKRPNFLKEKIVKIGQPMWSLHSLRHRFARQLLVRREPYFFIMEKLGHSSLANTMIYLHNVLYRNHSLVLTKHLSEGVAQSEI